MEKKDDISTGEVAVHHVESTDLEKFNSISKTPAVSPAYELWGENDPMPDVTLNLDPAVEKRLVRKLDMRLLSMLALIYLFNYLDKTNIAQARLGSLEKDLNLSSIQYSTIISCFYIGYLLMQLPSNLMLNRVRPSLWIPFIVAAWGVCSACCGVAQNFGGLFAARFMVGVAEAGFFPGALYLMSCFYTKKEMAFRSALLFSAFILGGAFGGLMASGIMTGMEGKAGIAAWRWLFIIEGLLTLPIALLAMFVLPDLPEKTRWLTPEERKLAVYRLARQSQETAERDSLIPERTTAQQTWDGLTDLNLWILILCQTSINTAASWTNFLPTIVKTLGYKSVKITLLLTAPPWLFAAILSIANGWHSDRYAERAWHIMIPMAISVIGLAMVAASLNVGVRYSATFLMVVMEASYGIILSWIPVVVPGPPVKRATAYAQAVAWSNASFIYSSYFYPKEQGPRYWQACCINAAFAVTCIASAFVLRIRLKRLNRRLEEAETRDMETEGKQYGSNTMQLLVKHQLPPGYRYLL